MHLRNELSNWQQHEKKAVEYTLTKNHLNTVESKVGNH